MYSAALCRTQAVRNLLEVSLIISNSPSTKGPWSSSGAALYSVKMKWLLISVFSALIVGVCWVEARRHGLDAGLRRAWQVIGLVSGALAVAIRLGNLID